MHNLSLNMKSNSPLTLNLKSNSRLLVDAKLPNIKVVSVRINTTEYWSQDHSYIPEYGTIIVYSDYRKTQDEKDIPAIKIADGTSYLVDLPFVADDLFIELKQLVEDHINNHDIHVSNEEKQFWNNKLNYDIDGEILIFNRY